MIKKILGLKTSQGSNKDPKISKPYFNTWIFKPWNFCTLIFKPWILYPKMFKPGVGIRAGPPGARSG